MRKVILMAALVIAGAVVMGACEQTAMTKPSPPSADGGSDPSDPPSQSEPDAPSAPATPSEPAAPPPTSPSEPTRPIAFIPSSVKYEGKVGKPFRAQLPAATGGKPPIKYDSITLGDGLRYNAQTRTVTGTPEKWRQYLVWLRATDSSPIPRRASLAVYINIDARCPLFPKYASVQWSGRQGQGFRKVLPASEKSGLSYRWAWKGAIVSGYDIQSEATLGLSYANGVVSGTPDKFGIVSGLYEGSDGDGCLQYSLRVSIRIDPPAPSPAPEVKKQCVSVSLALKNHAEATRSSGRDGDTDGLFNIRWTPATLPAWVPATGRPAGRVSESFRNLRFPGSSRVEAETCTLRGTFSYGDTTVWLAGRCASSGIYSTASTGAAWKQYMRSHTFSGKWMCTPQGCRSPNQFLRECQ